MRVVLDTNVLFAAFVSTGFCHELVNTISEKHAMVCSIQMLKELQRVLIEHFGEDHPAQRAFLDYSKLVELCEPKPLTTSICRDPDDDWVLAAAIEGGADCIVPGDQDLLLLKAHQSILILPPRQFIERFQE